MTKLSPMCDSSQPLSNMQLRLKDEVNIFVYLSSLPVAHLSDAPRKRLVVTGDSARIQDKTTDSTASFFNALSEKHRHTGPRLKVFLVGWLFQFIPV